MRFFHFVIFSFLSFTAMTFAEEKNDTIVARKSLFLFPHTSYQSETSLAPGITLGYYFKTNKLNRISSVSSSLTYTFKNQFTFNISPKLYFNSNKWYLYSNLNCRNYPSTYYGVSNAPTNINQTYTSQNFAILLQPQYIISDCFFVGALLAFKHERTKTNSDFENRKLEIFNRFGKEGWEDFSQTNIGIVAALDTRNNQFYPDKGFFAKSTLSFSSSGIGSKYSIQETTLDVRHYIPIFTLHTFAWQAYYAGVYSNNEIPFQLLPSAGSSDGMRGFQQNQYRKNILLITQTEYRIPLYKKLKMAVFCSTGDVVSDKDFKVSKLKFAYGAGVRYQLNDQRVHLRIDLAKNNYGDKLMLYLTASEAF